MTTIFLNEQPDFAYTMIVKGSQRSSQEHCRSESCGLVRPTMAAGFTVRRLSAGRLSPVHQSVRDVVRSLAARMGCSRAKIVTGSVESAVFTASIHSYAADSDP